MSIKDLEAKNAQLKAEIEANERKIKEIKMLAPEAQFAIELHDMFCHYDHTEYCSWFYEIEDGVHQWDKFTHARWHEKAEDLLTIMPDKDTIIRIGQRIRTP